MRLGGRPHGAGALYIRELADGQRVYYGRWRVNGERRNGVIGPVRTPSYADGLTKAMAEARLRELMSAEPKTSKPAARGRTLGRTAEAWIAHIEAKGAAPTYVEDARSALTHHIVPFLGAETPLREIDRERAKAFRAHLLALTSKRTGRKLAPKTINNYLTTLSSLLSFAATEGWIAGNPALGLTVANKVDTGRVDESEVMWLDDVERLIAAVMPGPHEALDRALYRTATQAGARKGELLALRWRDARIEVGWLDIPEQLARGDRRRAPKGKKARSVPMAPEVATALLGLRDVSPWTAPDDPVFADPHTGKRIAWTPARSRYLEALERAGLGHFSRFHDLRHTFASVLAKAGVPERKIQQWCGHSSPQVTRRYMHFAPPEAADLEAVAAAFGRVTNHVTNLRTVSVPENTSEHLDTA